MGKPAAPSLVAQDAEALAPGPAGPGADVLLQCLAWVAQHHGDGRSLASWSHGLAHDGRATNAEGVVKAAEAAGYVASIVQRPLNDLPDYVLPAIVLMHDAQAAVLVCRQADGRLEVAMPESDETLLPVLMSPEDLLNRSNGFHILIKPRLQQDDRAGEPAPPLDSHWFWGALWRFRSHYSNVILTAVMINVLTLAGIFFTMNVYDRVVPTHAYPTLWTLAIGTALAMCLEFFSRQIRSHLVDAAGKKVDLVLGALLFRRALGIRLEARPASTGAFANRLREFESLREFTTSATVSAFTDLPFALLFLVVVVAIGGQIAWVPAIAVVLIVATGVVIQWPLSRYMHENLRESSLKQGLLVEALEGIETIKSINAQSRMQRSWEDYSAVAAGSFMKSRLLTSFAMNFVVLIQQLETVVLVVWGVYLIHQGTLSQGALIAVVMLARQILSPMAQVVGLGVRFQQAKASLQSLNQLMKLPTDRDAERHYLSKPRFSGSLRTDNLTLSYPGQTSPAIDTLSLNIRAGERVAILGRIGSGKSTLLRLLNGLYLPSQGSVLADDIDIRQIDPADIRHNIGLITQDCKLFHGTLRENLKIGLPHVSDERLMRVCQMTGLTQIVARQPKGMDMMLGEGGAGLSGGQRQLVALARCLLADSPILLMDEPTSAMDAQTESAFIMQLKKMPGARTLVLATHRLSLLDLVDRIVVLDQGRVVADGPKDKVMAALTGGGGLTVKPTLKKAANG